MAGSSRLSLPVRCTIQPTPRVVPPSAPTVWLLPAISLKFRSSFTAGRGAWTSGRSLPNKPIVENLFEWLCPPRAARLFDVDGHLRTFISVFQGWFRLTLFQSCRVLGWFSVLGTDALSLLLSSCSEWGLNLDSSSSPAFSSLKTDSLVAIMWVIC